MRNKQLQEKLREMLTTLEQLDDDILVAHYTGLGLVEMGVFGMLLLDVDGQETELEDGFPVDCIVINH